MELSIMEDLLSLDKIIVIKANTTIQGEKVKANIYLKTI